MSDDTNKRKMQSNMESEQRDAVTSEVNGEWNTEVWDPEEDDE